MSLYSKAKIAYYSGTGGTAMAANYFQRYLLENGVEAAMEHIMDGRSVENTAQDLLILLFPVHAFHAPAAVYRWLNSLEQAPGTDAAVISISGGGEVSPNTACRVSCIRGLEKKGYRVVYESMLIMPSNFAAKTKEPLATLLIQILPNKVKNAIDALLSGTVQRSSPRKADLILSYIGRIETYGAKIWGRFLKAESSCIGCGLCAKECPSGNITMKNHRPQFGGKCHMCMRCIYRCPVKAITPRIAKFVVLKDGYDLSVPSQEEALVSFQNKEEIEAGSLFAGVIDYLENK